jgi:hypothetical protein
MRLTTTARERLQAAGISQAQWARQNYFPDGYGGAHPGGVSP